MWYKDLLSRYIDCNSFTAKKFALKKRLCVQGINDYEIPCKAADLAGIFQQQDKLVIETGKSLQFLTVGQFIKDRWQIILGTKTPIYDSKNNPIGTFGYGMEISKITSHFIQLFKETVLVKDIKQGGYILSENFTKSISLNKQIKLTARESETLFLLIRGKTAKEIANILGLSTRTTEQYIEQLRAKFDCSSRSELISKAFEQGFFNYIPSGLLHNSYSLCQV